MTIPLSGVITFGAKLKREREARGLSAFLLGASCKPPLNPSTIYQYEAGATNPRIPELRRLATALGISIADLLEGTDA